MNKYVLLAVLALAVAAPSFAYAQEDGAPVAAKKAGMAKKHAVKKHAVKKHAVKKAKKHAKKSKATKTAPTFNSDDNM